MKLSPFIFRVITAVTALVLMCPGMLHAQVIRIGGGANVTVSGGARIILDDGGSSHGSIHVPRDPVTFTWNEKTPVTANKNFPASMHNILVNRNDITTDIMLGKTPFAKSVVRASVQAFPNPTTERFTLTVTSDTETADNILLQDASGKIVERRRVNYRKGLNTIPWDMSRHAVGTYVLVFENAPEKYLKLVKQ